MPSSTSSSSSLTRAPKLDVRQAWIAGFATFAVLSFALWAGLFAALGVSQRSGFTFLGITALVHFACIAIAWVRRRQRTKRGLRKYAALRAVGEA